MRYPKTMPYTEFNAGLCKYKDALRRAYRLKAKNHLNPKEKWARDALDFVKKVESSMMDEGNHNFVRWLKLEKCGFTHPKTGETIRLTTSVVGTIEPSDVVYIYPKTAGDVTEVNVKAGEIVAAGTVLCTIDTKQVDTSKMPWTLRR